MLTYCLLNKIIGQFNKYGLFFNANNCIVLDFKNGAFMCLRNCVQNFRNSYV